MRGTLTLVMVTLAAFPQRELLEPDGAAARW